MTIRIKRVYEPAETFDGFRVLVDRLWPRGISKEVARLDLWAKEISPTNELRQWYNHEPETWTAFKERYFVELDGNQFEVERLVDQINNQVVTLVYSSKHQWNNALALKEYLETKYPKLR